jgi:fucose permease
LAVILNFLIVPFGLGDPIYSSILSVTPIVSGMVGCIITSIHLKKYQKYKYIILFCMVGSTCGMVFFLLMLWTQTFLLVVISIFSIGLFIVPLIPAMLEFACETSFPIGEATATGFIYAIAHIFGGLGGMALTELIGSKEH